MAENKIRFLLGGEEKEISNVDPSKTLLDYLRYDIRRTGTKEGCGEGDCGACTVVVGSLKNGKIQFDAVNACIIFLPTLDGKVILTVEDLVHPEGSLHPIQQAMADFQGTQCGFCTPGFIMSIFAHIRGHKSSELSDINDTLIGNLCRCTGYGPIIEATKHAIAVTTDDHLKQAEQNWTKHLTSFTTPNMIELSWTCPDTGKVRQYFSPKKLTDLADLCKNYPRATLLAGGTDVGLWVTKQLRSLDTIIYLGQIADLSLISENKTHIEIGAGVTFAAAQPTLTRHFPDLGEVIRRIGSTQIRNSGTIGGNIANGSPIGDSMPVLIALNTTVVLQNSKGQRCLPLEDYFISYGKQDLAEDEFLASIRTPYIENNQYFRAYKVSKRFDQDISAVCGAICITLQDTTITDARISYGGVAAIPVRAWETEAAFAGKKWTESTVLDAMSALKNDITPISDMRASAEYRMKIAQNMLMKAFIESRHGSEKTRILGPMDYQEAPHV